MDKLKHFDMRIVLLSQHPSAALKALDKPGLAVCDVVCCSAQLVHALSCIQPHAVLLHDDVENPASLLAAIAAASPIAPPRIISRAGTSLAADAQFDPQDPSALPDALLHAFQTPVAVLAAPSMAARLAHAQALLNSLGMPSRLLGCQSIALAAAWLSAMPYPAPLQQYWLYPLLSQAQNASPAAIERRIRSAIEATWLHGDLKAQGELFGLTVSAERGKPTNAEFLFLLSEHIRRLL